MQDVNMGRELYETEPTFRATLTDCDKLLQAHLGESILKILYPESGEQENSCNARLSHLIDQFWRKEHLVIYLPQAREL